MPGPKSKNSILSEYANNISKTSLVLKHTDSTPLKIVFCFVLTLIIYALPNYVYIIHCYIGLIQFVCESFSIYDLSKLNSSHVGLNLLVYRVNIEINCFSNNLNNSLQEMGALTGQTKN